ncbi:MAG: type II toxin-antitoxin system HicA family toxin [Demequinaceae bacterium]|nr:type II toxin-antitoxin system HicA family toxin [Demequinaceae bacterium]
MLRILTRAPLNYRVVRQRGSHRLLLSDSRPDRPLTFAFHDRSTLSPQAVRVILVDTIGLDDNDALELL